MLRSAWALIILLLAGCIPASPGQTNQAPSTMALPTVLPHTDTPQSTAISADSPLPFATSTMAYQRWRIDATRESVDISTLSGTIVFTGPNLNRHFLFDTSTRGMVDLPGLWVTFPHDTLVAESPDRRCVAYTDRTAVRATRVHVSCVSPNLTYALDVPEGGTYEVVGWINNDLLAIAAQESPDGTIVALRPWDKSFTKIPPTFPSLTQDGRLNWNESLPAAIYYDPSLAYAVIRRYTDYDPNADPPRLARLTFELWSVDRESAIWTGKALAGASNPSWSPNGDMLAVAYLPYVSSQYVERTCFQLHLVSIQSDDQLLEKCSWLGYSWSPGGAELAAWQGDKLGISLRDHRLKIYDLDRMTFEDYSIHFSERTVVSIDVPPVWSPDGRFIAFSEQGENLEPVRTWILDRETAAVRVLMNGVRVEGWLQ